MIFHKQPGVAVAYVTICAVMLASADDAHFGDAVVEMASITEELPGGMHVPKRVDGTAGHKQDAAIGRSEAARQDVREDDKVAPPEIKNKWERVTKEQCIVKMKEDFTLAHIPTLAKQVLKWASKYAKCPSSQHGLILRYNLVFRANGLTAEKLIAKWFAPKEEEEESNEFREDSFLSEEEGITARDTAAVLARLGSVPKDAVFKFEVVATLNPMKVKACVVMGGPFKLSKKMQMLGPKFCLSIEKHEEERLLSAVRRVTELRLGEAIPSTLFQGSAVNAVPSTAMTLVDTSSRAVAAIIAEEGLIQIAASITLELQIAMRNEPEPLKLRATMTLEPTRISLDAELETVWCNAFGLKGLCIANLKVGLGIGPVGNPSRFAMGGEVGLGPKCKTVMLKSTKQSKQKGGSGGCIGGGIYIGMDTMYPKNNYFAAHLYKVMLVDIIKFALPRANLGSMSKFLSSTGFPDGIRTSFSLTAKRLGMAGFIPAGFYFAGTIMIMGYKCKLNINIDKEEKYFKFTALSDPLNLGNIIKLQRSPTDTKNGPIFHVEVKKTVIPVIKKKMVSKKVHIEGSLSVLGIKSYVNIRKSNAGMLFHVEGPMFFGVFQAKIRLEINYGSALGRMRRKRLMLGQSGESHEDLSWRRSAEEDMEEYEESLDLGSADNTQAEQR